MNRIYFDNAATTALNPEVLEAMMPYLTQKFGNPSSIYSYGRETKTAIENARKSVAKLLGCKPGEIFFTSGGTESTNMALVAAVRDLGCRHIISSAIEHHATLHCTEMLAQQDGIKLSHVRLLEGGTLDLDHLKELLASGEKALVTLMHANNEIGTLLDVEMVGRMCEEAGAVFHCDMVQTIGHYPIDFSKLKVHFASAAAHKFHGPKGVGILYVNEQKAIKPLLHGGSQERNMRAGTENLYGIVGFAKALELAQGHYETDIPHITGLRDYLCERLTAELPQIVRNGCAGGPAHYTLLNVSFPKNDKTEMLLFALDMAGICVSGGSACTSGASSVSHVIKALHNGQSESMVPIRFSFCRENTRAEVDAVVAKIKELI
jgi:cysteine desulfurase